MICGKCGNQCDANEAFCNCCGTPLGMAQNNQYYNLSMQNMDNSNVINYPGFGDASSVVSKAKLSDKNKKIGIIAVASVVAIVLVIILILNLVSDSAQKVAKNFVEFDNSTSVKVGNVWDLVNEDFYEGYLKEEKNVSKSDINDEKDDIEDKIKERQDDREDDDRKFKKAKALYSGNLSEDEYEDLEDIYDDFDVKINDAKKVVVKYDYETDGEATWYYDIVTVVKVGLKWYVSVEEVAGYDYYYNF